MKNVQSVGVATYTAWQAEGIMGALTLMDAREYIERKWREREGIDPNTKLPFRVANWRNTPLVIRSIKSRYWVKIQKLETRDDAIAALEWLTAIGVVKLKIVKVTTTYESESWTPAT